MTSWWPVFVATLVIALLFAVAWRWCVKIDNYSPLDAFWACSIGLCALFYALTGGGDWGPRLIGGGLGLIWALRLGGHLQARIRRHHPSEDSRYHKLRDVWEGHVERAFFWLFQAQALLVILLSMPFFLISRTGNSWGLWEWAGLLITLTGLIGETISDRQMDRFKEKNSDPKGVCREGLWKYSRHPNYFFEFIIWVGFFLFACGSHWGWLTLYAPACILFLLLKVTGIPPTEASAVKRKGDAYRDYQATTSPFIPLPPKKPSQ